MVIQHGSYCPELNAYVAIAGGKGSAKGLVVGLGEITTFHLKYVSFLEKNAPSLGWSAKPKYELSDTVGKNREFGWVQPYRGTNL